MKEIDTEELKQIQLEILLKIDEFCDKENIKYTLAYGTLIGAIRHKGYIPWDDDIDIAMPRPDYNRFINSFNGFCDYLVVLAPELDLDYYAPYANVYDIRTVLDEKRISHRGVEIGVKIDVFPVDATPDDLSDYQRVVYKIRRKNELLEIKRTPFFPVSNYKVFIMRLINYLNSLFYNYSEIQKQIIDLVRIIPFDKAKYVDTLSYPVYDDTRVSRVFFENYIDVEFEHRRFKCIQNYDDYLHRIYGDYMKLPPIEKQVPHHGFKAYWKD